MSDDHHNILGNGIFGGHCLEGKDGVFWILLWMIYLFCHV